VLLLRLARNAKYSTSGRALIMKVKNSRLSISEISTKMKMSNWTFQEE
jgi:hypothetical protein